MLDNLAARGLGDYVKIDYNVIRGLATTPASCMRPLIGMEIRAIAGGGRYDQLVSLVSDGKTISRRPGSPWAMWCWPNYSRTEIATGIQPIHRRLCVD